MKVDIRWIQRLENYKKALSNLCEAVDLSKIRELSKLEKQGLIQEFEITYEWGENLNLNDVFMVEEDIENLYLPTYLIFHYFLILKINNL